MFFFNSLSLAMVRHYFFEPFVGIIFVHDFGLLDERKSSNKIWILIFPNLKSDFLYENYGKVFTYVSTLLLRRKHNFNIEHNILL